MRRFLPDVGDEDLDDLYGDALYDDLVPQVADRPYLYLDMVASVDGAAAVAGRTRALGGVADRRAFFRLRDTADAILVGASTVRAERYGPPNPTPGARNRRGARGQAPVPTIVVVTASLELNPGDRLFEDPDRRPTVLTTVDADPDRRQALSEVADVVEVGEGWVDLPGALRELRRRGVDRLLCEGGPTLNAQLLADHLVDELFLTVSPSLVGSGPRIVAGELPDAPREVRLRELREHDGELLLRYRVSRG